MYGVDKNYSNGNRETIHPHRFARPPCLRGTKQTGNSPLIRSPLTVKRSPLTVNFCRQSNLEHSTLGVLPMYYIYHLGYNTGMLTCHILVLVNIL